MSLSSLPSEERPLTQASFVSQASTRPSPSAAPSTQAPSHVVTNSTEEANQLRNVAASVTNEANCKLDDVKRLQTATQQALEEVESLLSEARDLIRWADSLERRPTGEHVDGSKHLKLVERACNQLSHATARQASAARDVCILEEKIALSKTTLEDALITPRSSDESLEEISAAAADVGTLGLCNDTEKGSRLQHTQTVPPTEVDTETDDVEVLEDTAEVRKIFERKVKDNATTPSEAKAKDTLRAASSDHDLLAEYQILAELQASAIPLNARQVPQQEFQLKNAGAQLQRLPLRGKRPGGYRPMDRDLALGLKWTLLSSEMVRDDLVREIRDGGNQPYVAGHIAVMRRKLGILLYFAQEHDAPADTIIKEVDALEDALATATPLVNSISVREAEEFLLSTDGRNQLHLTLRYEGAEAINVAREQLNRKRKRVDDSPGPEARGSMQDTIGLRVKCWRMAE